MNKKKSEKNRHQKKLAFKSNVKMLIDATKNALKKTKQVEDCNDNDETEENEEVNEEESKTRKSKTPGEAQLSFFYTNDKYFLQFDDNEIIKYIKEKYPDFMKDDISDVDLKKIIVAILQDKEFVLNLLDFYNLNIQDFFRFMFRLDTAIFKGPYLMKLQKIIVQNGYKI